MPLESIIPKKWGEAVEESMREVLQRGRHTKGDRKGLRMRGCSVRASEKSFKVVVATMP